MSLQPAIQGFLIRNCQIANLGDLSGNIQGVEKNNLPVLLHNVSLASLFPLLFKSAVVVCFHRRVKFSRKQTRLLLKI